MAPRRKTRQTRRDVATTSQSDPSFDDHTDDNQHDQFMNEDLNNVTTEENHEDTNENDTNEDDTDDNVVEKQLKANVWNYAKKITTEQAQCMKCKLFIKTVQGGTTTLRKHLVSKHGLCQLELNSSPRQKKNTISREKKKRLDHLANLAIFEDGRTFGDFRRSGITKFFAEAIPGNIL
jgi:hypothetical protein